MKLLMKTFDFTDTLLKLCSRHRSAQDRVVFIDAENNEHFEPTGVMKYDADHKCNIVYITPVE